MIEKLKQIEKLANGNIFFRIIKNPVKYCFAQLYRYIIYPVNKKTKKVKCKTIFSDKDFYVNLPSNFDIYYFGAKSHPSEVRLTKYLSKFLKQENTFLDVGAHIGYYSFLASNLVGKNGKVVSIEASKKTFADLLKNTTNCQNLEAKNIAFSNKNETLVFHEFDSLLSENNTLNPELFKQSKWYDKVKSIKNEVEGKTVDIFLEEEKLKPDFIKIDVEGAEDLVVEGMKNTLNNNLNLQVSLEIVNEKLYGTMPHKAVQIFESYGFKPFAITNNAELKQIDAKEISNYINSLNLDSENIIFKRVA